MEALQQFCTAHGLAWDDDIASRFATYVDLLVRFNAKMNLIGPFDRAQIERELLIDSLAAAVASPPSGSVLDVGTGAGLPGIPLAIIAPDVPFTLVEPRQKRATFVRIAANRLGLDNIEVVAARIEDTDLELHEWLISKAFRAPPEWLDVAVQHCAAGGQIVCLHATSATHELRTHAEELELTETQHIADVARHLDAPVPHGRSVTVFRG